MKFITNNIISFIFIMLIGISGYTKNAPPAPTQKGGVSTNSLPPPGTPIDNNLILLALAGTLFGIYTIYKHKKNKKRPI